MKPQGIRTFLLCVLTTVGPGNIQTIALIYHSCIETSANLRAGLLLKKEARVIHENSVYGQSPRAT